MLTPPRRNPKYRFNPIPSPVSPYPDIDGNVMLDPVDVEGYQTPEMPTSKAQNFGLTPEMMRMLKAQRMSDLGAALLAQSGFQAVAPTLGEGFGKAMMSLPDWGETVQNATARMMQIGAAQKKQMEESELSEFFQANTRKGNESAEQWLARLLPGLAGLNSAAAREAAQSIMQTLSATRDELVDIGGHLARRNEAGDFTGDLYPKTPSIGDLTAAQSALIANTEAEHKQFRDETQEDEIRAEGWRQAWENNSEATMKYISEMNSPVAQAVHDQIFLQSLLSAVQPEAKIGTLKGAMTVNASDPGIVKLLKDKFNSLLNFTLAGDEPDKFLSAEDRDALLGAVQLYMETASDQFGRKLTEFQRRAEARGLDFKQIGRDIYELPGLATRASQGVYNQGNKALNQRPRRPRERTGGAGSQGGGGGGSF